MAIDLTPLLTGGAASDLRCAGVTVGAPAAEVDRAVLTGGSEDIDAIALGNGFLRCGDVALSLVRGVVDRIIVRGPSLDALAIKREEDIERAFGPAGGHARVMGWRIHHYPARRFAIAWDREARRVDHVVLSASAWQEPRLGARDLLQEVLSAFPMLEISDWAEPVDHPITKVRYRRIAALSSAFGLGTPADLVSGSFLAADHDPRRRRALEELAASGKADRVVEGVGAALLFRHLLHYRRDVEKVVTFAGGWLEAGLGMMAVAEIERRIGRQVAELMTDIDRWLCTLMDPADRMFALSELLAKHGWPDVDLLQLERDYELGIDVT